MFPSNSDMKTILKISVLMFLTTGMLSACKASPMSGDHPTKLAGLIAHADHIAITNRLGHAPPRLASFSLTISGDEARKILRAATTARFICSPPCTDSAFGWDLRFYRETHFLAVVHMQGSHFVFGSVNGGEEYVDDSGVLERLDRDLYKRIGSQF